MTDLVAFLAVAGLVAAILAAVVLPILAVLFLVAVVFKLVMFVLFLPFRMLGAVFGAGIAVAAFLLKGFALALAALVAVVVVPVVPLLLIGGIVYLLARAARGRGPAAPPRVA